MPLAYYLDYCSFVIYFGIRKSDDSNFVLLLKIAKAIRIAKKCMRIVYENIYFAIGVKLACLLLGMDYVAEDYVLSGALPNSSWTEMGPCPSIGCIVFPIEAKSCGACGCTSSAGLSQITSNCASEPT